MDNSSIVPTMHVVRGVPVMVENSRPDIATAAVLERLDEALALIGQYQPWRLRHLQRDVRHIHVVRFPCRGAYIPGQRVCVTELTFLDRRDITAAPVASSIIHEGMHARVDRMGVRAEGRDRAREERLCRRAELAFGESLPAVVRRAGDRAGAGVARPCRPGRRPRDRLAPGPRSAGRGRSQRVAGELTRVCASGRTGHPLHREVDPTHRASARPLDARHQRIATRPSAIDDALREVVGWIGEGHHRIGQRDRRERGDRCPAGLGEIGRDAVHPFDAEELELARGCRTSSCGSSRPSSRRAAPSTAPRSPSSACGAPSTPTSSGVGRRR